MTIDRSKRNQVANKEKAEGDRNTVEANAEERRKPDRAGREELHGVEEAGSITNRPLDEEEANQEALPARGDSREGAHAGHNERHRKEKP